MKKFIVFAVLTLVSLLCFVPVYGEEISLGTADDSVEVGGAEGEIESQLPDELDGEKAERIEEIMSHARDREDREGISALSGTRSKGQDRVEQHQLTG